MKETEIIRVLHIRSMGEIGSTCSLCGCVLSLTGYSLFIVTYPINIPSRRNHLCDHCIEAIKKGP